MGAKASLEEGPGLCSSLVPSPTLENIQAAYEEGEGEAARELIKQACCVECSEGIPGINGVSTLKFNMTAPWSRPRVTVWVIWSGNWANGDMMVETLLLF